MQPPIVDDIGAADRRLAALSGYDIFDTPAEPGFDDIAFIASSTCATPVALVTLIDRDRQWFKARVGVDMDGTPLEQAICAHALGGPDLLVIPDLTLDPRTRENPLVVSEPHVRFYAGSPLVTPDGVVIGTLCVIDMAARPGGLSDAQAKILQALARQVIAQMELRRAVRIRDAAVVRERQSRLSSLAFQEQQAALLELGARLRDLADPAAMAFAGAETVARVLRANRAGYGSVEDGREIVVTAPVRQVTGSENVAEADAFRDHGSFLNDLKRGETIVVADVMADERTRDRGADLASRGIGALVNVPLIEQGRLVAVLFVQGATARDWTEAEVVLARAVADQTRMAIARLRAENQQRLLNQELGHRLKNTFAMIQAIATQTLRPIKEHKAVDAFEKRVFALSSAHDLLVQQSWFAARIGDVVAKALETCGQPERFTFGGPELRLNSRVTLSLSLLLHELATNASKYGALSTEAGRVVVDWRFDDDDVPTLVMRWTESGGPDVREPDRKGFGSRLIRMGLVGTGMVELRYPPSGFQAEMRAAISQIQEPGKPGGPA